MEYKRRYFDHPVEVTGHQTSVNDDKIFIPVRYNGLTGLSLDCDAPGLCKSAVEECLATLLLPVWVDSLAFQCPPID